MPSLVRTIRRKTRKQPKAAAAAAAAAADPVIQSPVLTVTATLYLWNQERRKAIPLSPTQSEHSFPTEAILAKARAFSEPGSTASFMFKKVAASKPRIVWNGPHVTVTIPLKNKKASYFESVEWKEDRVEFFVDSFRDGAADGYLEGNAVMHTTADGEVYEFILDDHCVTLTDKDGKELFRKKYDKYW